MSSSSSSSSLGPASNAAARAAADGGGGGGGGNADDGGREVATPSALAALASLHGSLKSAPTDELLSRVKAIMRKPVYVTAWLELGGMRVLVDLLGSPHRSFLTMACSCLADACAAGGDAVRVRLAELDLLTKVVRVLKTFSEGALVLRCARILGNVSISESPAVRSRIVDSGCAGALLAAVVRAPLSKYGENEVIIQTLTRLCYVPGRGAELFDCGAAGWCLRWLRRCVGELAQAAEAPSMQEEVLRCAASTVVLLGCCVFDGPPELRGFLSGDRAGDGRVGPRWWRVHGPPSRDDVAKVRERAVVLSVTAPSAAPAPAPAAGAGDGSSAAAEETVPSGYETLLSLARVHGTEGRCARHLQNATLCDSKELPVRRRCERSFGSRGELAEGRGFVADELWSRKCTSCEETSRLRREVLVLLRACLAYVHEANVEIGVAGGVPLVR